MPLVDDHGHGHGGRTTTGPARSGELESLATAWRGLDLGALACELINDIRIGAPSGATITGLPQSSGTSAGRFAPACYRSVV
jgi:hypothetical protein